MKIIRNNAIFVSLAVALLLSSCYSEKPIGTAYYRPYRIDSTEIEIPIAIVGRGNLHALDFSPRRWRDTESIWIHISKIKPVIEPDSIVLLYHLGFGEQKDLKGQIEIKDSILTVKLKEPRYNNKDQVKRRVNFEYNGTYVMKFLAKFFIPPKS